MKLDELLLTEKEIPILGNLHKIFFDVPIHPKLLDSNIKIDKSIVQKISSGGLDFSFMDNGFVKSVSMNGGLNGELYFDNKELNYKSYALTFINFSEEKFKEFSNEKGGNKVFIYSQKNINTSDKALFFRNWAIEYMSEVFRQIF